ncbi:MAG: division/cell wall cluster transcriptional repressor MraZ [Chloroflexi bacterium]|nr:division/cell wall cluster transcriptional repressor MraZ [Chloroflexota bacterium]
MFFGEFEYKLDEKGRIPLPPRFRDALKEGVVLSPGFEKCITARSLYEWKKFSDELTRSSVSPSKLRRLNRAVFATAFSTRIDGQGRIAVPAPLRDYAGIRDGVVVAGANSYLEIWSKEHWAEEKATSQEQAWQIIESLEKR